MDQSIIKNFKPQSNDYMKIVERYANYIESPVLRLKFLNAAMQTPTRRNRLMKLPFVGSLPERAQLILELSKVLPPNRPVPFSFRLTSTLYRLRIAVYAVCLIAAVSVAVSAIYAGSKLIRNLSSSREAQAQTLSSTSPEANRTNASTNNGEAVTTIASEAGLPLDKVWLAEKGDGYEFYSNGARILTQYETAGEARSFYRFDYEQLTQKGEDFQLLNKPVGIVYHLTESDLLPFSDKFNASLIHNSETLMEYAARHKLYNYLIDRFGRIYRIVNDDNVAYHAGNSVWSDGRSVYVNLNASFLGISFEGKSTAGKGADGINEAQIYAARVLTAVLRSKYQINDANCTTHGLVSTNPSARLLGHHTDWVAGFPFEALGLSNKYESELLAISHLGFAYDLAYLSAAGGKKWAGLTKAEAVLWEEAKKNSFVIEEQRRALWENFQRAYAKQHALDEQRGTVADEE